MKNGVTTLSRARTTALFGASLLALSSAGMWQWRFVRSGHWDFAGLLTGAAGFSLLVATLWLTAIAAALVAESITAGRTRAPHWLAAPAALRTLMLLTSGAVMSVGLAGTAAADPPAAPATDSGLVDGLTLPDRALGDTPRRTHAHLVRPGDTLWAIASATSPRATTAELVGLVRDWHEHNRASIGPDPDRLVPGQVLRTPPGTAR